MDVTKGCESIPIYLDNDTTSLGSTKSSLKDVSLFCYCAIGKQLFKNLVSFWVVTLH